LEKDKQKSEEIKRELITGKRKAGEEAGKRRAFQ